MAIRDLLWACPICGAVGGLRADGRVEACASCGTRFRRGEGASIVAERVGETPRCLPAAAWVDRLPEIPTDFPSDDDAPRQSRELHRDRVRARFATGFSVLRVRGAYLNRIERFGPDREGVLVLETDRLRFEPVDGTVESWHFDDLTAIQPSSSTLQIKARGREVVSFRFPDGSARYWEERLAAALRRHYRETGRGEIVEFQPRIVVG